VKVFEIQSSPRGESSDSITAPNHIEACKSNNTSIVVDTLNVWHERLPKFDYEAIGAKYKAVKHEAMTEAESKSMGAYSIVDPTLSERRSNRLRNSNVELWPALQAQTPD
jgi:FMN-dependent NADH-azoreductase